MKLTGKVIELQSGSTYTDKEPRARIKIDEADYSAFDSFYVKNAFGLQLDDTVEITVTNTTVREIARAAS